MKKNQRGNLYSFSQIVFVLDVIGYKPIQNGGIYTNKKPAFFHGIPIAAY